MPDLWQMFVFGCECLAAVAGTLAFIYNYPAPLKNIAKLWGLLLIIECIGIFYKGSDDTWMYNLFHPIFYFILVNVYRLISKNENLKNAIQVFNLVFILSVIFNSIFFQGVFNTGKLQSVTILIGSIALVIVACFYLIELIVSEDRHSLSRDSYFWLSISLIIYATASAPFLGMLNYLHHTFPDFTYDYFRYIYNTSSILLNLGVTLTFVCRIPSMKLS